MSQEQKDSLGPVAGAFRDIAAAYLGGRLSPLDMLSGFSNVTRHKEETDTADVFLGYALVLKAMDDRPAVFGKVVNLFDGFLERSFKKNPLVIFDSLCALVSTTEENHPLYEYVFDKLATVWHILSPMQRPESEIEMRFGIRRGQLMPTRFDKPKSLGVLAFPEMN